MPSAWRHLLDRLPDLGFRPRASALWGDIEFDGGGPDPRSMEDAVEFVRQHIDVDDATIRTLAAEFLAPPAPNEDLVVVQMPQTERERALAFILLFTRAAVVVGDQPAAELLRLDGVRTVNLREEAAILLYMFSEQFQAIDKLADRIDAAVDHLRRNYHSLVTEGKPRKTLKRSVFLPLVAGPLDRLRAGQGDPGFKRAGSRGESYIQLVIRVLATLADAVRHDDNSEFMSSVFSDVIATVTPSELERWCFAGPESPGTALLHVLQAAFYCDMELCHKSFAKISLACRAIEQAEEVKDWRTALQSKSYWSYFVSIGRPWRVHLDAAIDELRALIRNQWLEVPGTYFGRMLVSYENSGAKIPASLMEVLHGLVTRLPTPDDHRPEAPSDKIELEPGVGTPISQKEAARVLDVQDVTGTPSGDTLRKRIDAAAEDHKDPLYPLRKDGEGRNRDGKLLREWVELVAERYNGSRRY